MAKPTISLNLSPVAYVDGCYAATTKTDLQLGQKIYLEISVPLNSFRVKYRVEMTNGFTLAHTAAMLEVFATNRAWGTWAKCRALLVDSQSTNEYCDTLIINENFGLDTPITWTMLGLNVLATSNEVSIRTPVEPIAPGYTCSYGRDLLLAIGRVIPSPPYISITVPDGPDLDTDPDVIGNGRTLTPPIQGRYYFIHSNCRLRHFETDTTKRGFDCTTYILSAFDVQGRFSGKGDGAEVARLINARDIGVNEVSGARLASYFDHMPSSANGMFTVWRPGHHVVMLLEGLIYEYTTGNVNGFACTPVVNWFSAGYRKNLPYNVWALPGTRGFELPPEEKTKAQIGIPTGTIGRPTSLPPTNGGGGGSSYTVVSGDSLSLIAGRYWKDVLLWPILYDANKSVVGPDPNKILPGQKLSIPSIGSYSSAQLSNARSRGRNC
jgi:LysM repeat protein